MTGEMTFTQLVKLIHPDVNPNVQNAGDKMREAIKNRSNVSELYKLALNWGLVEPPKRQTVSSDVWSTTTDLISINDMVEFYHPQYGNSRGVVVDIKHRNSIYQIYIVTEKGILVAERNTLSTVGDFKRKYRANDELVRHAHDFYNHNRPSPVVNRRNNTFSLEKNTNYNGQNIWVRVNGVLKRVIRTTENFVVYFDQIQNKERRKSLKSVYGVRR